MASLISLMHYPKSDLLTTFLSVTKMLNINPSIALDNFGGLLFNKKSDVTLDLCCTTNKQLESIVR